MNSKESIGTSSRRIVISEDPHGKIIVISLLLAFLWGGNSLSIKVALDDIAPMALAFIRFLIGLVIVGGMVTLSQNTAWRQPKRVLSVMFPHSDLHITDHYLKRWYQVYVRFPVNYLYQCLPVFLRLYLHIFGYLGDRLSLTKTLGIIVAFVGVFVTVAPELTEGQTGVFGDLTVLVSGCFFRLKGSCYEVICPIDSSI